MAKGCWKHIQKLFAQLRDCRAFELLKVAKDRGNYLITRQAKIIAMTCTHAALKVRTTQCICCLPLNLTFGLLAS